MAVSAYAKQANDETLLNHARRIQCRSTRRMGELLVQVEPAKNQHDSVARDTGVPTSRKGVAADAGIKERQRKTSIRIAKIPEADFEEMVEAEKAPFQAIPQPGPGRDMALGWIV